MQHREKHPHFVNRQMLTPPNQGSAVAQQVRQLQNWANKVAAFRENWKKEDRANMQAGTLSMRWKRCDTDRWSRALFCSREGMGCDTVFELPATLSTASSLDSAPTNGRRITLQPNLSVATRPTLYMRRLAPHSTLACPKNIRRPVRIRKYIACLAGKLLHVMDVYVVFHVQFEVFLANGIDLHLYGICDTVQANRDTRQQRDERVGFQFPLVIISALAPQYLNCSVLSGHVHQLRGVTRFCKQRSSSDAKTSLQTAAFPTDRDRLAVTSAFRLDTVVV